MTISSQAVGSKVGRQQARRIDYGHHYCLHSFGYAEAEFARPTFGILSRNGGWDGIVLSKEISRAAD